MYLVIVFFKQKTAYEMRISDWSSDVCSSDLPEQQQQQRQRQEARRSFPPYSPIKACKKQHEMTQTNVPEHRQNVESFSDFHQLFYTTDEIGRASCRERVCQYV